MLQYREYPIWGKMAFQRWCPIWSPNKHSNSSAPFDTVLVQTQDIVLVQKQCIVLVQNQDGGPARQQDMYLVETQGIALVEEQRAVIVEEGIGLVEKPELVLVTKRTRRCSVRKPTNTLCILSLT